MAAQHGSGGRVRRRTFLRFLSRIVPGGEHLSVAFGVFLFFHVLAGLTCVATGAVAATSRKRPGRHPRVRHRVLGSLGRFRDRGCHVGAAVARGRLPTRAGHHRVRFRVHRFAARKVRWNGWRSFHILGMSLSYVVLFTAFYVDNGPHLPLVNRLPTIVFWIMPSLIGLPLVTRAVRKHTHLTAVRTSSPLAWPIWVART